MELVLLAISATAVMMSIYGKYAYDKGRRRLGEDAAGSPSAPSTVGAGPHYVVIERPRTRSTPPRSRRRHRPMRESE